MNFNLQLKNNLTLKKPMNFNLQLKIYLAQKPRSDFFNYAKYKESEVDLYSASEDKDTLKYNSHENYNVPVEWKYNNIKQSYFEKQLKTFKRMQYLFNFKSISRQS